MKHLMDVPGMQNEKGVMQSSPNTGSNESQVIILPLQSQSSKDGLHIERCRFKYKASVMYKKNNWFA